MCSHDLRNRRAVRTAATPADRGPTPAWLGAVTALALGCAAAQAQVAPAAQVQAAPAAPMQNIVTLSASATAEVTKDLLTVIFGTTREGPDAAGVQAQLKSALDAALAEARKVARPRQLEVQTGNFSLYPRHTARGISGWQGSTEMVVQGLDAQGIAQLTGRVTTLNISRVGFSLSREARQRVEADVAAQAIAAFRDKAQAVSREFGFGAYTLRELSVQTDEPPAGGPMPLMRAQAAGVAGGEALPVEAGKASVLVTVSGSVQMLPR